jgi:hypothetical protein
MKTELEIRERIIELNYYLVQSMVKNDTYNVDKYRIEINSLIDLFLNKKDIINNDVR